MKKIVFVLILLVMFVPVFAEDSETPIIELHDGYYTLAWLHFPFEKTLSVYVEDAYYKHGYLYKGEVVFSVDTTEDYIKIPEKYLMPGQDYVLSFDTHTQKHWQPSDIPFKTSDNITVSVPRTINLVPLEKNEKKDRTVFTEWEKTIREAEKEYVYSDNITFDAKCRIAGDMFKEMGDIYNKDLALLSVVGAGCSYNLKYDSDIPEYLNKFLKKTGFQDIEIYHGEKAVMDKDDSDKVLYAISHRNINVENETYNLISVVVRGTVLGEWFSNFNIGQGMYHEGFRIATEEMANNLLEYMNKYHLTDKKKNKIWLCGHSRGAAVVNLAVKLLDSENIFISSNVYAYAMATPNVTLHTEGDAKVFNFINNGDFVPLIPYWDGWRRYGTDISTKDMDKSVLKNASLEFKNISSYDYKGFSDKEINGILKELNRVAPTVEDFYNKKYNPSAKDGGKTTYDCCNILGNMAVKRKYKEFFAIPNDFNKLMGLFAISNVAHPKIINAHSIEYYYSLVGAYNLSF